MSILTSLEIPQEAVAEFCKRRSVSEFAIFGSAARRELRPESDIDVMLTFTSEARWDLYDLVEMKDELKAIFGRDVDIVERGTIRNPFRRETIMRDLSVVYAA